MENIYTNGEYFKRHPEWHAEDSYWKARQIYKIIERNKITGFRIADIGCGAGGVLFELSQLMDKEINYYGYDISRQAIDLATKHAKANLYFKSEDLLSANNYLSFDILLIIDVIEHIPDYIDFLKKCRTKANYKIYHIPLDLSVSSVLSDSFVESRRNLGHVHYFSLQSAIASLKDTGHVIIDYFFTDVGTYYIEQSPALKRTIANLPRRISAFFNISLAAKIFGRYSLMVLTI
jgi:SAM-dependent methyltransferase